MKRWWSGVLLVSMGAMAQVHVEKDVPAPMAGGANVSAVQRPVAFDFVPRVPGQATWRIEVGADGAGTYAEAGDTAGPTVPIRMPIWVSPEVMQKLQAGAAAVDANACETKLKKIAQTGKKTIAFGEAKCEFNFSDDAALNDASMALQAIAATVQYGARLKREHRFDRLGLSAEMDSLVDAVKNGRAIELGNIAPVLQSLVDDEEVIGVVRRRAKALLDGVPAR